MELCAQTYRVRSNANAEGCHNYKEVYEYDYVSEKPVFPGGEPSLIKYIRETRQYPEEAYNRGIQGRVMCSFVINVDGTVSNVKIVKGVECTLNKEAIRIFSGMPAWTPGRMNGVAVPVRVVHAVPFRK